MKSLTLVILGITLKIVAAVIVPIEQGLLEGEQKWTITGDTSYFSFKGIPYAAPPVGNLRFKAPEPPLSWEGIRNASRHGNVCPQVNQISNQFIPGSEDCLFLNVYTPNLNPYNPLPVMFYIHGGGYAYGSGNDDLYGPDFLLDENVVAVTFNYRLDTLGFLSLDSKEVPGNAGMKDQVAALRWVQRNIGKFGGDPNQVTVFGQSAGGASCFLHTLSPMSKGLFKRVIAMSGVPISEFSAEFEPKRRAFVLSKSLGFETENTTEILELLQNVPVRQLLNTSSSVIAVEGYLTALSKTYYVPIVEKDFGQERFLIEAPEIALRKGKINNMDILLGYTNAEAVIGIFLMEQPPTVENFERYREALVPRSILYQITSKNALKSGDIIRRRYSGSRPLSVNTIAQFVNYNTDVYNYQVQRFANHLSKFNKNIYFYQFTCMSERNVLSQQGFKYGIHGVAHLDDQNYVFNANKYNLTVNKDFTSFKMMRNTCKLLTNFAKLGNPTPDNKLGVKWSKYNAESQIYLDIGENLIIDAKPNASMMDFWKSIYIRAGLSF